MSVGMAAPLAVYGCDPARSRGRQHPEAASKNRSHFRRDCDRVIHATAFRRLKYKTQVFVFHEGDHYRTRLTHTLEVAQIARALARQLGLDEDLTETLALAHDLGHPPFGHAGERALDACLRAAGGFDHNAQTLRVVTALEHRYPEFEGLNLTWEALEGIVKHNGPLADAAGAPLRADRPIPVAIAAFDRDYPLELASHASLEAQAAAIADDIAYDAHDIDDGLRAGLFTLDDLKDIPLLGEIIAETTRRYPTLDDDRRGAELVRQLIARLIGAVATEAEQRLGEAAPRSVAEVRGCGRALVGLPPDVAAAERAIKTFLRARMYRHERIMAVMDDAQTVVRDLFGRYRSNPSEMPEEWRHPPGEGDDARARRIGDFIAGMTDRFAIDEHRRLFDSTPDLR